MKYIIKIFIVLLLLNNIAEAELCSSVYDCNATIDNQTGRPTGDLTCTLPSTNTNMHIIALDVFEADGTTLKTYFGTGENVCNVLGWMDDGAKKFTEVDGLIGKYTEPITLKLKPKSFDNKFGARYGSNTILFDSSPLLQECLLDGNDAITNYFANLMKYMTVHEFFFLVPPVLWCNA